MKTLTDIVAREFGDETIERMARLMVPMEFGNFTDSYVKNLQERAASLRLAVSHIPNKKLVELLVSLGTASSTYSLTARDMAVVMLAGAAIGIETMKDTDSAMQINKIFDDLKGGLAVTDEDQRATEILHAASTAAIERPGVKELLLEACEKLMAA